MAAAFTRRGLLLGAAASGASGLGAAGSPSSDADFVGQPLRPWRRGGLDIHHIATGKGDATLIIGPDGSSLMIDAGASDTPPPASLDIRPNADRRPGEWIGRYARRLFPPLETLAKDDLPDENACSAAIRLRYGAFGYFAAGDLTSQSFDGTLPWRDVETPTAQVAGPVDVAVAAHHGMFDATGADVARALKPRAWIIQGWHVAHPSPDALERMLSPRLYPGPRDVFATGLSPANALAHKWLTDRLASREGHVIIRVAPGGASYRVVITDHRDEADRVVAAWGSWAS